MTRFNRVAMLSAALALIASPAVARGGWGGGGMGGHGFGGHGFGGHGFGGRGFGGHGFGGHGFGGHGFGRRGFGFRHFGGHRFHDGFRDRRFVGVVPFGFGVGLGFATAGPWGYYYPDDYYDDGYGDCPPAWDPAVGGYVSAC